MLFPIREPSEAFDLLTAVPPYVSLLPGTLTVLSWFMAKQQSDKADKIKRRPGPPPTGVGTLIGVRIQPDDLDLLDAWRAAQPDKPGRPEAIRRLVENALSRKEKS
jgi:hypothetical protein